MLLNWLYRIIKGNSRKDYMPFIDNKLDKESFKEFIYEWNILYPADRWWRQKYKIPFNSEQHRKMSFVDIYLEWEEDKMVDEVMKSFSYKVDSGKYMDESIELGRELTIEEKFENFKKETEKIDLSKYDD
jgi:hypothetical protein